MDLYTSKIKAAENGDIDASKWLIQEFIDTVKNNRNDEGQPLNKPSGIHTQFNEPLLDYFAKSFCQILDNVNAGQALGIKTGEAGRPANKDKLDHDVKVILEILRELDNSTKMTKKAAKQAVARKIKMNINSVDAAWKNNGAKIAAKVLHSMEKKGK
jgi:hypothetical protein